MSKLLLVPGILLLGMVIWAAVALIAAIPIYFLWNWLMPVIFGITTITYWQAWGIVWLSALLFKGSAVNSNSDD